jgi:hypothetical protein
MIDEFQRFGDQHHLHHRGDETEEGEPTLNNRINDLTLLPSIDVIPKIT